MRKQFKHTPGAVRTSEINTMRVIGRKPVLELLLSDRPVSRVLVATGTQGRIIGEIIREAKRQGVRVDRIAPGMVVRALGTENHQGVAAETSPVQLYTRGDLGGKVPVSSGLLLALDGVTDPHHLGSIARSALGAGCDALLLPERRGAPVTEVAVKASAGSLLRLPLVRVRNLADSLISLKKDDWWVYGAAGEGAKTLWKEKWPERVILVFGSEGGGLSRRIRDLCDVLVSIPLRGRLESLSVSAAASVLLFEISRARESGKGC